mgnify:CR=1 FL=1
MPYKILALKNFCIGQFGYPNFIGEIKGIKPDFEFNDGIDYLGSKMYQFEDFMLTELGVHCRIGSLEVRTTCPHYLIYVHCRIGSLEVWYYRSLKGIQVHCRIGSLEVAMKIWKGCFCVHCRIGSLEVKRLLICTVFKVHCRIGSLEDKVVQR